MSNIVMVVVIGIIFVSLVVLEAVLNYREKKMKDKDDEDHNNEK